MDSAQHRVVEQTGKEVEASFGSVIGAVVRRYNSLVYRSAMHCYIGLVGMLHVLVWL